MTRFITLALGLIAAAAWSLLTSDHALAWSPETTPSVTGDWNGLYRSDTDPQTILPVRMMITDQVHRRFSGSLLLGDDEDDIEGTIDADNKAHIIGRAAGQATGKRLHKPLIIAKLALEDFGGGAATLDGAMKVRFPDGTTDEGHVVFVRSFTPQPDRSPPDLRGTFDGSATSGVDGTELQIVLEFKGQQGTRLTEGRLAILDPRLDEPVSFNVIGTVSPTGEAVLIGLGPAGFVRLDGEYVPAPDGTPRLIGDYLIRLDLIRMNFTGDDFGGFDLISMNIVRPE